MSDFYPMEYGNLKRFIDREQDIAFSFDLGVIDSIVKHGLDLDTDVYASRISTFGSLYEDRIGATGYNYSKAPTTPYEKEQQYAAQIERGFMPPLGNGFRFVIDRRPEGREDDYISAVEYTRYFSQAQIPIADKDHRLHNHDIAHISSYVYIFGCKDFADLARTAATNALSDPMHCETFTNAMDGFGNTMRNIEEHQAYNRAVFIGTVNAARLGLNALTRLQHLDDENYSTDNELTSVKQIENQLGLASVRLGAVSRDDRLYKF